MTRAADLGKDGAGNAQPEAIGASATLLSSEELVVSGAEVEIGWVQVSVSPRSVFETAALKALVHAWRVAELVAARTPRTETSRDPDIRNPWNNLPVCERVAIEIAVRDGLWPEDVPLVDRPVEACAG